MHKLSTSLLLYAEAQMDMLHVQGLHDPHIHILKGGMTLRMADFSPVTSIATFKDTVKTACGKLPIFRSPYYYSRFLSPLSRSLDTVFKFF